MKKLSAVLLTCALFTPGALSAASFEGTITMSLAGKGAPAAPLNFSVKGDLTRIDMAGPDGQAVAVVMDSAKQEMTMIMLTQRMFMVRPMPKPGEIPANIPGAAPVADPGSLEKTGVTEKILGYDCVKYLSKAKDGVTEMWLTDQLGRFMGMGPGPGAMGPPGRGARGGSPAPQGWEAALAGKDLFPLRVVTTSTAKDSFRLEVTAVEKKSLPSSLFAAPAGFQDIGAMMRGMMPPGMKIPGLP